MLITNYVAKRSVACIKSLLRTTALSRMHSDSLSTGQLESLAAGATPSLAIQDLMNEKQLTRALRLLWFQGSNGAYSWEQLWQEPSEL